MSYTKFVILAQERTGSTFLQTLLDSHNNIMCLGELFNPSAAIRGTVTRVERPITPDEDVVNYLERFVYHKYDERIKVVGFRLFYNHALNDTWARLWPYLRDTGVRILHLKRRNLLDRYLSHALARRSNVWAIHRNEKANRERYDEPIWLPPKECFQDFQRSLWQQQQNDTFFGDSPKLEIIYEELCDGTEYESRRIQEFLGLTYQPLTARTRKQRKRQKIEIITNYVQLKEFVQRGLEKGWARQEWLDFFCE